MEPMTDDLKVAVQAFIDMWADEEWTIARVAEMRAAIRHVADVARRDALRDALDQLLAEAEKAVRRG